MPNARHGVWRYIDCKMQRRMMVKLRGGTAELRVKLADGVGYVGANDFVRTVTMVKWKMSSTLCASVYLWQK